MVNYKNCPYMSVLMMMLMIMMIREGKTDGNRMNYHTKLCLPMYYKEQKYTLQSAYEIHLVSACTLCSISRIRVSLTSTAAAEDGDPGIYIVEVLIFKINLLYFTCSCLIKLSSAIFLMNFNESSMFRTAELRTVKMKRIETKRDDQ